MCMPGCSQGPLYLEVASLNQGSAEGAGESEGEAQSEGPFQKVSCRSLPACFGRSAACVVALRCLGLGPMGGSCNLYIYIYKALVATTYL